MYDDDYATCESTYVTLRIYCDFMTPDSLSEYLGIIPSSIQIKGQRSNLSDSLITLNSWFLSSENIINSKDSRRHLDYILDIMLTIEEELKSLLDEKTNIDLSCFWSSKDGHGGPLLSQQQSSKLAKFDIDFWYDLY